VTLSGATADDGAPLPGRPQAPPVPASDATTLAAIVAEGATDAEAVLLFDAWLRSGARKRAAYDRLDDAYGRRFSGTRPAEIYWLLDAAYAAKDRARGVVEDNRPAGAPRP
jgi:hypothetical protein